MLSILTTLLINSELSLTKTLSNKAGVTSEWGSNTTYLIFNELNNFVIVF